MRILRIIFALFIIYGLLAFTGWGMSIFDAIPYFSPVEWPLGTVSGVVRDSSSNYMASNTAYSRIQAYDQKLNFKNGWSVDNGGGDFRLIMNKNDQVEVLCVSTLPRFVYSLDCTLVSQGGFSYDNSPNLGADSMTVTFDTPIFLLPFSSPVYGWVIGVIGVIGLGVLYKFQKIGQKSTLAIS